MGFKHLVLHFEAREVRHTWMEPVLEIFWKCGKTRILRVLGGADDCVTVSAFIGSTFT